MKTLIKYAIVTGDTWLYLAPTIEACKKRMADFVRHGDTDMRIERWEFPILPDGTHGKPAKIPVKTA